MGNVSRFLSPEMLALARAKLRGEPSPIIVHIGPDSLIPLSQVRKELKVSALTLRRVASAFCGLWCCRCVKKVGKRACGCRAPRWGIPMKHVEQVVGEVHRRAGQRLMGSEK